MTGEIKLTVYTKEGNKWEVCRVDTDKERIYKDLAGDLIHKKLHKCSYIRSMKDECNYDGTRTITVYYSDGVKRVYIVEA